jgi:hypothetical protein
MSYSDLYEGLKIGNDDKSKNSKRSIDVQPSLIPRSKRVAQNVAPPKPTPVVKKPTMPLAPSQISMNNNSNANNNSQHVVKPSLTLKDANGNELVNVDNEFSVDIQAALAELEGREGRDEMLGFFFGL